MPPPLPSPPVGNQDDLQLRPLGHPSSGRETDRPTGLLSFGSAQRQRVPREFARQPTCTYLTDGRRREAGGGGGGELIGV